MDPIDKDGNRVPVNAGQSAQNADVRPKPGLGRLDPSGLNRKQRGPKAVRERARLRLIEAQERKKEEARAKWNVPSADLGDAGDV